MKGIYIVEFDIYPGIYKIGKSKNIDLRFKQYQNNTIILGEVKLLYTKEFENFSKAEKDIHNLLKDYRVKENREFFKGDIEEFIKIIDSLNSEDYKMTENNTINSNIVNLIANIGGEEKPDNFESLEDIISDLQYKNNTTFEILKLILELLKWSSEEILNLKQLLTQEIKEIILKVDRENFAVCPGV